MNILQWLVNGPGPDPRATTNGLLVTKTGWGRWQYSGRPAWCRSSRPTPDGLDLAVMRAAGQEPSATEIAAARPGHRCPSCGRPCRRRFPLDADQRCYRCWTADPLAAVADPIVLVDLDVEAAQVADRLRAMRR
ncbi:MAG TPA: hypothetical protein VF714_04300 [Jatrophihabitans sp.]